MMFFVIFISVFFLVGFGLLGYGLWSAFQSTRAGSWPTTDGSITMVDLKEERDEGTTYQVQVEYSYSVAGRAYVGTRLAFGYQGSSERASHSQIYSKLKSAKTVTVRYNPADPSISTLSFGFHLSIKLLLAFAITWLAFTTGFAFLWWLFSQPDQVLLENLLTR